MVRRRILEIENYPREKVAEYFGCRFSPELEKLRVHKNNSVYSFNTFGLSDGGALFYREWRPADGKFDKIILCIHGLHSHGEKFVILADFLTRLGAYVIAPDLRGHGLSWRKKGERGDIVDYRYWISDLAEFTLFLINKFGKNIPLHIIAESMGGAVAIHFAASSPPGLKSLVLLSPAVKTFKEIELSIFFEALLLEILRPKNVVFTHKTGIGLKTTNSTLYIRYMENDPLRLSRITGRYYYQVLKMLNNIRKLKLGHFYPTLIFYGEYDRLIDFNGIKDFMAALDTKEKTLMYIPRAFHELLTDLEAIKYGIYRKIVRWIRTFSIAEDRTYLFGNNR